MISGLSTLILIAAAATADAAEEDNLEQLLASLAPEGERGEVHFVERRNSPLLNEPLVVTGQFRRTARGDLIRHTVKPRESTQTLTANMIVIERPGQSPRNHSLGHIPELAVLYHALSGFLGGDADALRQHFEHELTRSDDGWQLELEPRDDALAEQVESLTLSGRDDTLRHFVLSLADGETIETELGRAP